MDETMAPETGAGWSKVTSFDGFDAIVGPYFWRLGPDGATQIAFLAGTRHLNKMGTVHGGCLMALADSALFAICRAALDRGRGVTVALNGDFIGSARSGDVLQATGEVTRAGGSLVFARGAITASGRPALSFSGIIKRIRSD